MEDLTGTAGDADLQQTGVEDLAVAGQETTGTPDAGDGLKAAAAAERKKRQEAEAQLAAMREEQELIKEQLNILRANNQQPAQDALAQNGLRDDDFIQAGSLRKLLEQHSQQVLSAVTMNQFATTHPDYAELVGSFDASGRFRPAETLKQAMKNNPGLRGLDIALSQNPAAVAPFAYEAARLAKELTEIRNKSEATDVHLKQRELADKTGVLSGSAAGGGVAMPAESAIASSDEVFNDIDKRVMAGEFG